MKAYIWTRGDRSVGIDGYNTEVNLVIESLETDRERIRFRLKDTFGFIWDEDVRLIHVIFDDEMKIGLEDSIDLNDEMVDTLPIS